MKSFIGSLGGAGCCIVLAAAMAYILLCSPRKSGEVDLATE